MLRAITIITITIVNRIKRMPDKSSSTLLSCPPLAVSFFPLPFLSSFLFCPRRFFFSPQVFPVHWIRSWLFYGYIPSSSRANKSLRSAEFSNSQGCIDDAGRRHGSSCSHHLRRSLTNVTCWQEKFQVTRVPTSIGGTLSPDTVLSWKRKRNRLSFCPLFAVFTSPSPQ